MTVMWLTSYATGQSTVPFLTLNRPKGAAAGKITGVWAGDPRRSRRTGMTEKPPPNIRTDTRANIESSRRGLLDSRRAAHS